MDDWEYGRDQSQQQGPEYPPQTEYGQQQAGYQQGQVEYESGGPTYELPPLPARGGMSRRGKVILALVIAFVVIGGLLAAGFIIDRVLFPPKEVEEFSLEESPVYRDALYNIRNYFYHDFSEAKITEAARLAVEKEEKKGVDDPDKLLDVGLTALIKALGDQHSQYLTPSENKRLSEDLSGSFYGVGFTLRLDEDLDRPRVVTVIKGSPSEKAGIKPNDVIMSVDGKDTKGEPLDAVVLRIRGKKGTKVKVKVERDGKLLDFTMTREKIDIPDVESELVDGNIGLIRLYEFNTGVSEKVRQAVRDLQAQGAKGFILDMRNNPGGLLDEAVKVASVFINDGPVVSYQIKGRPKAEESASGGAETNLPLVVLVNGGSASSSEITAGALKDRGRAVLVGSKTYGKGSVQKLYELENQGAAKLTIALYYLPNGESIDGKGIQPDISVQENKEDPAAAEQLQLDRAKQVLNNLMQGKPATGEALLLAA